MRRRLASDIECVHAVDEESTLWFLSSSERFSVYEVAVLVASCGAHERLSTSLRAQACRRMKPVSIF